MTINETLKPLAANPLTSRTASQTRDGSKMKAVQLTARLAAILYLVIAVFAGIAHGYVPGLLIVPGDAVITAHNIIASESVLRMGGIGSELVVLLSEVVVSVLLYVLLRPVNKTLSLLAAAARLVMTTITGLNLLNYFFALQLLGGAGYLAVFSTAQLQALALLFLNAHAYGFELGIAFFTLHVFVLGYLMFKSGYLPKILGILFVIAGLGYLIDSGGQLLIANYGATPAYIALPIIIAEIALPLWLLIKGVNAQGWEKRALETA